MSTKRRIKKKKVNPYTDDFKMMVIKEVMSGHISKADARRQYGIKGKSAILNWIRIFEPSRAFEMKKKRDSIHRDSAELEAENKRLREELDLERLRVLSLNVMIDIAEGQFKVPIRKKSGAKQ